MKCDDKIHKVGYIYDIFITGGAPMSDFLNEETQNDEIDLAELFHLLLHNYKLIIVLTALGLALSFLFTTIFVDPTYSSSSTVFIQPTVKDNQVSAQDLTTNQKLTMTYTEIAKSNTVLSQVVPYFLNDLSKEQIRSALTIKSLGDTQIISVSATTTDPELSADLVNRVVSVFIEEINEIMEISNLTVIDTALPNINKVGPNRTLNTLIGGVLGGMLSVAIILLRMMLNRTIKTRSEAERLLKLPVLGEIFINE